MVYLDFQDLKGHLDPGGQRVMMAHQDLSDPKELEDLRDSQDFLEPLDCLGYLGRMDPPDLLVSQDAMGQRVNVVFQEVQEIQVFKVHRVPLDYPV